MSLEVRDVTKDFVTKGVRHRAVDALSLAVEAGTFCTLLGPSGCGKTTLLRIIAGFEEATSGEVLLDGRSLAGVPPYRRGFPMVFQSYALFPHMTVLDNVAYGLDVRRVPAAERRERAERALALLGLEGKRDRHPAQLSGGQQQRVALARCLVLEPRIILLDEPLSNLDAGLRLEMRREIRSLQQRLGITALYVTHDQEEALAISDRIIVMNSGRIEQDGTPEDVYRRPATSFVARFMGCPNVLDASGGGAGASFAAQLAAPGVAGSAVVVREDAVVLREGGRFRGRVVESTFLGSRVQHLLELGDGTRLRVEEPGNMARPDRTGEDVAFDVLPERLHYVRL
jgi:ABC-type Fe3+/spermidine/putrescine transport system ATPase subunit